MTLLELKQECERLLETQKIDPNTEVFVVRVDNAFGEKYTSPLTTVRQIVTDKSCFTFTSLEEANRCVSKNVIDAIEFTNAIGVGEFDEE